jgi:hypothetical protein
MSDKPPTPHDELMKQIEKVINPLGPLTPGKLPNFTPKKGTEGEQHKKKEKKAFSVAGRLGSMMEGPVGEHLREHSHAYDLGGLGVLAAPSVYELGHEARKEKGKRDVGAVGKATAELAGLGLLAAPVMAQMKHASAAGFFDELEKLGAVSDDEAVRALQSLQDLEDSKPTAKQMAGYAGIGAVATPAVHMVGNAIKGGGPILEGAGAAGKARALAAHMAKGAIGGGALPIVQQEYDRHAKMKVLKNWVKEHQSDSSDMAKAAAAVYLDEVNALLSEALEKTASEDILELRKIAFGLSGIRSGIANVAGKVSPTLNKPVGQLASQGMASARGAVGNAAHGMQHSQNSFVQGMGNILHHKAESNKSMLLGAANPVGTAAEVVAGGVGNAASKGMVGAGKAMQNRFGTNDSVVQQGRAMTPMGRIQNTLGNVGQKMQQSFSQGGMGHKVLNNYMPRAAEIGGAAAVGTALHIPTGLSGVLGHAASAGLAKAAPVAQAALQHAPTAVQGAASAIGGAAKSLGGGFLQHAAEDAVGTGKQNFLAQGANRLLGGAGRAATHMGSIVPPPMH